MKTILATLFASVAVAQAVTITINEDTPSILDFSVDWGARIAEYGTTSHGPGGSTVSWLGLISRNRNFYFVDVASDAAMPSHGFGIRFWSDPEYIGAVPTAFGALNISFSSAGPMPQIFALDGNPYGARFVYGSLVPDAGGAWLLMSLGLAGIALAKRIEQKPV